MLFYQTALNHSTPNNPEPGIFCLLLWVSDPSFGSGRGAPGVLPRGRMTSKTPGSSSASPLLSRLAPCLQQLDQLSLSVSAAHSHCKNANKQGALCARLVWETERYDEEEKRRLYSGLTNQNRTVVLKLEFRDSLVFLLGGSKCTFTSL